MTSARSNDAWERVLAAIEADTAKTAAMLADDDGSLFAADAAADAEFSGDTPGGTTEVPAVWRLPSNPDAADLTLPPPEEMPPIPAELRDRIDRLRSRIEALQTDLARALQQARMAARPPVRIPQQESTPGFVDRKL